MKNKIKRFAKGDFHIPQPEIIFPETHITMRVGEGEKYEGSFSLQNEGEGTIRGLVYPSSYRVQCAEQGFDGNPVNIYYTYDGRGLVPGHVEHGKFTIVCNGGEYDIAFTAIICVFVLCLVVLKRARSAKETIASFKISKILEISVQIKSNEDEGQN